MSMYIPQRLLHTSHSHQRSTTTAVCNNWISAGPRMPGSRLDSEVSPSTDQLPETVCRLHYVHQIRHRTLSSEYWRNIYSQLPGAILAPDINILTNLLTYVNIIVLTTDRVSQAGSVIGSVHPSICFHSNPWPVSTAHLGLKVKVKGQNVVGMTISHRILVVGMTTSQGNSSFVHS